MTIDLKELAYRESERVEWKENVANVEDVVKTMVAFSNDFSNLGGGYIICGAKETKDEHGFPTIEYSGLDSATLKEVENRSLAHCREKVHPAVVPHTEILEIQNDPGRRILVFVVPATRYAHSYRSGGRDSSTYYIRMGSNTVEARNGLLNELLVRKGQLEPWDKRINQSANLDDIDLLIFRDYLQEMRLWDSKKPLEEYFSETEKLSDFIPPLVSKGMMDDKLHPKNFTILMFGKKPLNHFEGAYCIFSIYRGTDRSEPTAERYEITGTIVQQAKKLIERLNTENFVTFDKEHEIPNQVKYPSRALQEAVVNAIVHRDYEISQPVRVTVFSDRIEFNSPGMLPRAIDKKKFLKGKAHPHWRNQALAYFFNKLQLAQAEGQGIPTILRTMREEGCPEPVFELGQENVVCTLPAHPRHKTFKELHEIENKIVIGNLKEAYERTKTILAEDPYNFRAIELFCEVNNLLKTPKNVYNFLKDKRIDLSKINSSTLAIVADTLSLVENNQEVIEYAVTIFQKAYVGQLEEREMLKIALNLKKLNRHEEIITFLNDKMERQPALAKSASLLEERARARMSLASKCIDTGKKRQLGGKIRARAWDECRRYLSEAEKDLNEALENTKSGLEKEYLLKDIEFLNGMKRIAQKPESKKQR